jgi:hypothetical protein
VLDDMPATEAVVGSIDIEDVLFPPSRSPLALSSGALVPAPFGRRGAMRSLLEPFVA